VLPPLIRRWLATLSDVNCLTDGGVRAAYKDTPANFTSDWSHLNVRGQAHEAKIIWPVVAQALGLSG
jgi:hypothetical protein